MSLISDAIKRSQRERDARKGTGAAGQPSLDGFFPYVSPAPERKRSKLVPIAAVSLIGAGLLGFIAWSLFVRPDPQRSSQPSILPPPPSAVATKPELPPGTGSRGQAGDRLPAVDTSGGSHVAGSDERRVASNPPAPARDAATVPRSGTANPRAIQTEPSETRTVDAPVTPISRAPTTVDYEAQATIAFNAGDLIAARDKFQLATRNAPTARAWTNYGVTLQRLGDLSGASRAYQTAIGLDANYLEAWLFQGRVAVLMGQPARAVPLFLRAREIDSRNSEVNVELAGLEANAKNWTDARRFAEEAVRGNSANVRAHWYLAIAADQLRDFEVAAREYTIYLQGIGATEGENHETVGYARSRLQQIRGRP